MARRRKQPEYVAPDEEIIDPSVASADESRDVVRTEYAPGTTPVALPEPVAAPFAPEIVDPPVAEPQEYPPKLPPTQTPPDKGSSFPQPVAVPQDRLDDLVQGGNERQAAAQGQGTIDSFMGKVESVNYDNPREDVIQSITVSRVKVDYGVNNEPVSAAAAAPAGAPAKGILKAFPFPARHDQQKYVVASGDFVLCLSGADGRIYFLTDELPFIGRVVKKTLSTAEDSAGGAGLLALKVRRQALSGDPSAGGFPGATVSDLKTAAGINVDIDNVKVISPVGTPHGYRVGDNVLVTKRGCYYFAQAIRESFLAKIKTTGPAGEINFTTNHYWVMEQTPTYTYGGAGGNNWTEALADRSQTDPMGSGGLMGRHVDAENLLEPATSHQEATGTLVLVHMTADGTGQTAYYFHRTCYVPPVANSGDVLTVVAGAAAWAAPSGSQPSLKLTVANQSGTDQWLDVTLMRQTATYNSKPIYTTGGNIAYYSGGSGTVMGTTNGFVWWCEAAANYSWYYSYPSSMPTTGCWLWTDYDPRLLAQTKASALPVPLGAYRGTMYSNATIYGPAAGDTPAGDWYFYLYATGSWTLKGDPSGTVAAI